MSHALSRTLFTVGTMALLVGGAACGSSSSPADAGSTTPDAGMQQSLYDKYGGAPTVQKVVDDAVTGLLADCIEAPYFTNNLNKQGHDSTARLKSCLRLQFTALLGGPATYPGMNDMGDMCQDMQTVHADIGVPGFAFDKFIVDVASVLKADGVSDTDIQTVAPAFVGLRPQIVSPNPVIYDSCDAGVADGGAADGGMSDAGVADGGVADAGITDAGVADAGVADGGVADAGTTDAGVDAGP
jgi:hypothetical protein